MAAYSLGGDGVEAPLDQRQQVLASLGHGPVELAVVQGRGLPEPVLDAHPDEVVEGRGAVHREHLDAPVPGRLGDLPVAAEQLEVGDAPALQEGDGGVPFLGPDDETRQVVGAADARQVPAEEDGHVDAGVGRAEIVPGLALPVLEQGVDDVVGARLHSPLGLGPVHGVQLHVDPGLALPQGPLVHQDPLESARRGTEDVGRVVVVHHHPQRASGTRHRGAPGCGQGRQGQAKEADAQDPPQPLAQKR